MDKDLMYIHCKCNHIEHVIQVIKGDDTYLVFNVGLNDFSIWERIKLLFGKKIYLTEIVLHKEEELELVEFLQKESGDD